MRLLDGFDLCILQTPHDDDSHRPVVMQSAIGWIRSVRFSDGEAVDPRHWSQDLDAGMVSSFGHDTDGEIHVLGWGYRQALDRRGARWLKPSSGWRDRITQLSHFFIGSPFEARAPTRASSSSKKKGEHRASGPLAPAVAHGLCRSCPGAFFEAARLRVTCESLRSDRTHP